MSTVSMGRNVGPAAAARVAPALAESDAKQQRIPDGANYEAAYPAAAALERRCLTGLRVALDRLATALCGPRSDRWFRRALEGEQWFRLSDLCRLATHGGREARAAALAVVTELAAALGYRLEPVRNAAGELVREISDSVQASGDLHAAALRAASDGVVSEDEREALRPVVETAKRELADLENAIGVSVLPAGFELPGGSLAHALEQTAERS